MESGLEVGQSALLTDLAMCVNYYRLHSPGLYCCTLAEVRLDEGTRLHPGVLAMVNYGRHKQCAVDPSGTCFVGAPNFVLDVFPEHHFADYDSRRDCFERAGVVEYVAVQDAPELTWRWNRRVEGRFTLVEEDDPGMIRSVALPGFWVPTEALKCRNWWSIMAATAQGVTRLPHHEFMNSIWHKDDPPAART